MRSVPSLEDRPMRIRVREIREARSLTQDELAEAIGISQSTLSKMERGILEVTVRQAWHLTQVMECDVRDLFPDLMRMDS